MPDALQNLAGAGDATEQDLIKSLEAWMVETEDRQRDDQRALTAWMASVCATSASSGLD